MKQRLARRRSARSRLGPAICTVVVGAALGFATVALATHGGGLLSSCYFSGAGLPSSCDGDSSYGTLNAPATFGPGPPTDTARTGSYGKPFAENRTTGTQKQITMYISGVAQWDGTGSTKYFMAGTAMFSGATVKTTRYKMLTGGQVSVRLGYHR